VRAARAYFGCATLEAVELENGGGAAYGAGEHWERRVLFEELMTAVAPPAPVLSAITFGLLLDTGWYQLANWSAAAIDLDNDASGMVYGRGLGCAWATQRCDTWPEVLGSLTRALALGNLSRTAAMLGAAYFCTTPGEEACGYDGRFIGSCTLGRQAAPIPVAAFQYFDGVAGRGPAWGGDDLFADYCPYVRPYEVLSSCTVAVAGVSSWTADAGMRYSPQSQCFRAAISPIGYSRQNSTGRVGCYTPLCGASGDAYVMVGSSLARCPAPSSANSTIVFATPPIRGFAVDPLATAVAPGSGATTMWSTAHHGLIDCGRLNAVCRTLSADPAIVAGESAVSLGRSADTIVFTGSLPVLTAVSPAVLPLAGGVRVILTGVGLMGPFPSWGTPCTGLKIGGVAVTDFLVYNNTTAKRPP
jgi:hypothetical protein